MNNAFHRSHLVSCGRWRQILSDDISFIHVTSLGWNNFTTIRICCDSLVYLEVPCRGTPYTKCVARTVLVIATTEPFTDTDI